MIHLISTQNEIGEARRELLLPKLEEFNLEYCIHYGDCDNGKRGRENEFAIWKEIVQENINEDYLIIMEDDCIFREDFSMAKLQGFIDACQSRDIQVLLTGVSASRNAIKTDVEGLIITGTATATQLAVIFKPIYEWLLGMPVDNHVDLILTSFSQREITKYNDVDKQFGDRVITIKEPYKTPVRIGVTLPYLTGQSKVGVSQISGFEIKEIFETEEARLLTVLNQSGEG